MKSTSIFPPIVVQSHKYYSTRVVLLELGLAQNKTHIADHSDALLLLSGHADSCLGPCLLDYRITHVIVYTYTITG